MDSSDGIAIFAIFCVFGLPVLAWMVTRMMAHRERMEMMRNGFLPGASDTPRWTPGRATYRAPMENDWSPAAAHCALRRGVTVAMIGLAITIGLSFIGYDGGGNWHPGPWLLGGLIPLFIGVAQVMIAVMSGASFGPPRAWTAAPGAPPPFAEPPPAPNQAPTYDSTYTYRPGSTQELRGPGLPPERR